MKTLLSLLAVLSLYAAALADNIVVRVTDAQGLPVAKAQVVAVLKSGAWQRAELDTADGNHKCSPTETCVKIYAAAPGHEGVQKKYSGEAGVTSLQLKASAEKNSTIGKPIVRFDGIEGTVSPMYNSKGRWHMYSEKIGFAEKKGGKPVGAVGFELNRSIDVVTPSGQKFKLWVLDIMPQVSLVEYSTPK